MNKHFKKVLSVLKTNAKDLGFSRGELKSVAAKIADNLTLEEDSSEEDVASAIEDAVDDAMELLSVSQSAAQRAISNYKKKHNVSEEEDDDDDLEPSNEPQRPNGNKKTPNSKDGQEETDTTPVWAKSLVDQVASLAKEVSSMKSGSLSSSRRNKLEKALKDTGRFGERRLKEFDRIKDTFKTDDEFEDYLEEVSEDLEAYNQERADEGLGKLGVPGASATGKRTPEAKAETEKLSDAEIAELANEF